MYSILYRLYVFACIMVKGVEDFTAISGQIRRKDFTIINPKYFLFDILPLADFLEKEWKVEFSVRLAHLSKLNLIGDKHINMLTQVCITNEEELEVFKQKSIRKDWEGLILRLANSTYKGKRSKDILKYKLFDEGEFIVEGIETSTMPFLIDEVMVYKETMAKVIINFNWQTVKVGSGFSISQREEFFANPSKIIGKNITVQYFRTTPKNNTSGWLSLRLPTFKGIRDYE